MLRVLPSACGKRVFNALLPPPPPPLGGVTLTPVLAFVCVRDIGSQRKGRTLRGPAGLGVCSLFPLYLIAPSGAEYALDACLRGAAAEQLDLHHICMACVAGRRRAEGPISAAPEDRRYPPSVATAVGLLRFDGI